MFLAAMICWIGVKVFEHRRYDADTIPLSAAVGVFNAKASRDPIGRMEPKITVDEIMASIRNQLRIMPSRQIKSIFEQIARTKRIPRTAEIRSLNEYGPPNDRKTVWFVRLDVVTGGPIPGTTQSSSGFGLPIRDNYHPKAITAGQEQGERQERSGKGDEKSDE